MSLTYPNNAVDSSPVDASMSEQEVFVPSYARSRQARGGQKKMKTWMILAPLGGLVLIGGAAMMLMNDGSPTTPMAEPADPVVAPATLQPSAAVAPLTTAATPAPLEAAPAPQPVAQERAPVRAATPAPVARRAAPVERATPAPRIETPAEATGPRSYSASPSVPTTPAPPPPAIAVQPLS